MSTEPKMKPYATMTLFTLQDGHAWLPGETEKQIEAAVNFVNEKIVNDDPKVEKMAGLGQYTIYQDVAGHPIEDLLAAQASIARTITDLLSQKRDGKKPEKWAGLLKAADIIEAIS